MTKIEDLKQQLRETDALIVQCTNAYGNASEYLTMLRQDRAKVSAELEACGNSILAVCARYAINNPGNDDVISAAEGVVLDQRMGGECYATWDRVVPGSHHKDDVCRVVTWAEAYGFA